MRVRRLTSRLQTYAASAAFGVLAGLLALALSERIHAFDGSPYATAPGAYGGRTVEERHRYAALGCAEAAEVGLAPARRGEPGYWPQWDGDHDGVSCERWRSAR